MGFVLGFICGGMLMHFYHKRRFKVGDIIYLKPTGQKCIIEDKFFGAYWLRDMNGELMNQGFEIHKNLFDKSPPTVQ
jgi:hypothetical protein